MKATTARPIVGVGAIVVHDGALLMVKRGREPGLGLWSAPGGRVEHGESLTSAVAREVLEETGLSVSVGDLVGVLEVFGDEHFVVLDYLAEPVGGSELTPGADAADARWVPLDDVVSLECTPLFVETLRGWGVLSADE